MAGERPVGLEVPEDLRELSEERTSIMQWEGGLARAVAEQAAWGCVQESTGVVAGSPYDEEGPSAHRA